MSTPSPPQKTDFWRHRPLQVAALVALSAVIFGYGLGALPFIGPDEPRYVEIAREMYAASDWITPRLAGIEWFEKPALLYWLALSGYLLFGISEFAARIGVALLATAGVLLLYLFGLRTEGARDGLSGALVLVSTGLWIGFARGATFDLPLAVTIELALVSFFLWWEGARAKSGRGFYLCCFALGLAVLSKGLVGLLLPGAIIGLYIILTGELRALLASWRTIAIGAAVFLLTAAIWYAPMFARHGGEFYREFFVAHHFERYLTDKYRHPQPFYFFFFVALAGSFPWTAYLVQAAARDMREWRRWPEYFRARKRRLFLWLWALFPVLFFSFSGSKLPGYILPVFPALALLAGEEIAKRAARSRVTGMITGLLLIVIAAGVFVAGAGQLGVPPADVRIVATLAVVLGLAVIGIGEWRGYDAATAIIPAGVAVIVIATTHLIFPGIAAARSLRELSLDARRKAADGERLIFYLNNHHGVDFYATELPLRDDRSGLVTAQHGDQMVELLERSSTRSLLVMSYRRWLPTLDQNGRFTVEELSAQPRHLACSPGCDWILTRVRLR